MQGVFHPDILYENSTATSGEASESLVQQYHNITDVLTGESETKPEIK